MNEVPEKGRDTTGQGRAIGPNRRELPEGCSVPGPSPSVRKIVSTVHARRWRSLIGSEKPCVPPQSTFRDDAGLQAADGLDSPRGPFDRTERPTAAHAERGGGAVRAEAGACPPTRPGSGGRGERAANPSGGAARSGRRSGTAASTVAAASPEHAERGGRVEDVERGRCV